MQRSIKHSLILSALLILVSAPAALSRQMKIVVDKTGEPVGRYVRTNARTYTVIQQDTCEVTKEGNRVVTYSAEAGNGVVWCKDWGKAQVHSAPSAESPVIGEMVFEEGGMPVAYWCLGKVNGWYKIDFDGKEGYVLEELSEWDGMLTF